jgi:hypothetical protein
MCDALKYQKAREAREDLELAIRNLRAACEEIETDFKAELSNGVYIGTDRQVSIKEMEEGTG